MRSCAVVGAGTMGQGIATCFAQAGREVLLCDVDADRAAAGRAGIERFLERGVERGVRDGAEAEEALARVTPVSELASLAECEVVVEAVPEELTMKRELFGRLDRICSSETIFHTNTSTLSIAAIAAGSERPSRVVGTHYCNPAPLMDLVEVVPGRLSGDDAVSRTIELMAALGKRPVLTRDTPGFIVNFLWVPFENDCIRAVEAGRSTPAELDAAIKAGLGFPMGTFRLLDIVGLDVHKAVSTSLYDQLRDARFAPPPLVDRMISAGQLGRKSGEGFYSYG